MGEAAAETRAARVSVGDRIADLALRALVGAAGALPYPTRVRLVGAIMAHGVAPATRMGARIDENLSFVFPDMGPAERRRLGRLSADRTGRVLIENYSGRDLATRMRDVTPTGPGLAALEAAAAAGRPALLMTGHFGNYEAARACLIARGFGIGGLYRPMANALVNRHYAATMETIGGPIFPQGRAGTKGLIAHLRQGGMAMLLNDLYVGAGVELPFLGRPAMTSTHFAEIARRTGAVIVPTWGIRQPDGLSFAVELDAPLPDGDPVETARAYNAAVERRIRSHPEQWFWMHRRWKRKWQGGEGYSRGLHPAQLPSRRSRL